MINAPEGNGHTQLAPSEPDQVRVPHQVDFRMVGDMGPLFAAKAKARLEFKPIVRDRTVTVYPKEKNGYKPPPYTFDYATLASVRNSCDDALARNGLDVFHSAYSTDGGREVRTILSHSSGAYIESVLFIPYVEGWQQFGSAKTYAERYAYVAIVGVASEWDDDGNAADGNEVAESKPRQAPQKRREPPPPPKQSAEDLARQKSTPAANARDDAHPHAPPPEPKPEPRNATPPPPPKSELPTEDGPGTEAQRARLKALFVEHGVAGGGRVSRIDPLLLHVAGQDAKNLTRMGADKVIACLEDPAAREAAFSAIGGVNVYPSQAGAQ